jgi:hypothetical protein
MTLVLPLLVAGCTRPGPGPNPPPDGDDPTEHTAHTAVPPAPQTGETGTTGDTAGHTGLAFDCSTVPAGPRPFTSTSAITTEEDFDFDGVGLLLAQNFYSIKGTDRYGAVEIVATGLSGDAAGIRVAPNGDFVYASPNDGRLVGVTRYTGASRTLLSGLRFPNSLEMGTDGMLFASEFWNNGRLVWFDTTTLASGELGHLDYVNGMTLSMDEQVLYLASADAYWSGASVIYAVDRQPDGTFGGGVRRVADCPTLVTSLAVDVCGNLYMAAYYDGRVFRFTESTGTFELLADLGGGGYGGFSSIRFSPGLGGFSPTSLYATNRAQVYEIDVGVEGRHVLH